MEGNLPPGFRFHPTDEELITYYLNRKVSDFSFVSNAITDIDLNKCEPWDLPGKATIGEKEWYFFSTRDRKYPTGLRTNRATDAGYWKTTGKDKEILHSGAVVGMKKTLVFYKGRAPKGEKTNWVMHEYRLHTKIAYRPTKDEWVVCRVFQKSSTGKKTPTSPQSIPALMESSSDTNLVNEIGEINISHLSGLVSPSSSPNAVSASTNSNNINSENNNNSFNNNNYIINNNSNSNSNSFYNNSMDMNMNWGFGGETTNRPSFAWPSSLLNSNLLGNSSILRPLHYNSSQPRESASHILNPFAAQEDSYGTSSNSNFATSSSTVIDSAQQQPFQTGSIWRRC